MLKSLSFISQFYLDNLEEELNVLALRMLVKDLLVLFQAINEGVINVLGMPNHSPTLLLTDAAFDYLRTLFRDVAR